MSRFSTQIIRNGLAATAGVALVAMAGFFAVAAPEHVNAALANGTNVTISLQSVQPSPHKIYISLQKKDEFLQEKGSYGDIIVLTAGGQKDVIIPNVTAGEYSVSIWHDTDGDGTFTMDASGMPADGWGMYQGEKLRAMPTWDAVKFTVTDSSTTVIPVIVQYPKPKS